MYHCQSRKFSRILMSKFCPNFMISKNPIQKSNWLGLINTKLASFCQILWYQIRTKAEDMTLQCFYYPRSLFFVFLRIVFQSFLLERKFPVWLFWVHNNDFNENWYCRVPSALLNRFKMVYTLWVVWAEEN